MSAPAKYRKRPVVVEAMRWDGTNTKALFEWTGANFWETDVEDRTDDPDQTGELYVAANSVYVGVETGEWVLRDERGFYPCKPDIFEATYEAVTE